MSALAESSLSRAEARSLTDEVKGDAERLWRKLVELYEGGAHLALGYSSWAAYFTAEFGGSNRRAYQLLESGRIMRALESVQHVALPKNDRVARELVPLSADPEAVRDAWEEATRRADGKRPTAAVVAEVVAERTPEMGRKAMINANAAKRKLYDVLSSVSGYCSGLPDFSLERALSNATPDDVAAWDRLAGEAVRALNGLRRALKEER